MFNGVEGVAFNYIICGIIWALVLGFAVGNYACSLVHRLPRGRLLLDKKPYFGSCGALLQVRDLFPVISAMLLRHKCRYCHAPFPISHTLTELLVGALFVLTFLQYNFTDIFILIVLLGVFLITLAAIEANEKLIMGKIELCAIVAGMLLRVRLDGDIYGFFEGAIYGVLLSAIVWRKDIQRVGHIYVLPKKAELLVIGGLCVGGKLFLPFIALYLALWLVSRVLFKSLPLTAIFGFAVMLPVLYPHLAFPL